MSNPDLSTAIVYHVRLVNPGAHLIEVTCRIERPGPDGQLLSLPAWIPGSYLVRDYARHVVKVEAEVRGEAVAVRKVAKHTWRVAPVEETGLLIRALVYAADSSVRGAWLDARSAFFNGVCLFFRVHGQESAPCVVHVDPPDLATASAWRLVTSLQRLTGTRYDFGAFQADGYEDLIDHPVLMGDLAVADFPVAGAPHTVAIAGAPGADLEQLGRDLARLCAWHVELFGQPPPVDRYVFLVRALADGYGGLEHRYSSALLCRRDDLPAAGTPAAGDAYRRFLGLASHEYFHLWHVKRIRPAEFVGADLAAEVYTRQLWIFEGITSYYDDLALVRSGLITTESYLELLGRAVTQLYRTAGRRHQTLEEASFDAWIKFYRPDENSPNATVSYYLKGSLVALALDLEIRLRTAGASCLDAVMRALWRDYGPDGSPPLAEGAFERLAEEVTGLDLEAFFRQSLRSTIDPPLAILLAQFGIRLQLRAAETAGDVGGQRGRREERARAWMGLKLQATEGRLRITVVHEGGPAQQGGLATGDEIIAINGRRLAADNYDTLLDRLPPGRDAVIQVFRDDELLAISVQPVPAPRDTCYLTLHPEADAQAVARRAQWLGIREPATPA